MKQETIKMTTCIDTLWNNSDTFWKATPCVCGLLEACSLSTMPSFVPIQPVSVLFESCNNFITEICHFEKFHLPKDLYGVDKLLLCARPSLFHRVPNKLDRVQIWWLWQSPRPVYFPQCNASCSSRVLWIIFLEEEMIRPKMFHDALVLPLLWW